MLTVYGIETHLNKFYEYRIYFVATVLTVYGIETNVQRSNCYQNTLVATAPTVYGIETGHPVLIRFQDSYRCNSTYRLRYAPQSVRQQRSKATMRPTHCKYLNEVKVKQR